MFDAPDQIRETLRQAILEDEVTALARLMQIARLPMVTRHSISRQAAELVRAVRDHADPGLMEEFLAEYGLSTKEGVALMCLAEALLRVPDAETIDELIQDKIAPHDWGAHLGKASSSLVNASTWALMLTGHVIDDDDEGEAGILSALHGVVRRLGEPVVRVAVGRAMREMGAQFVLGRDINEAVRRGRKMQDRGYTYSYDMLGEAARTEADAQRYHGAYAQAIATLAGHANAHDIRQNPGISVKLSALHPRYELAQAPHMLAQLTARTLQLAQAAKAAGMGLNIDAEEADRLDLSLDVIEAVLSDPSLAGWDGFGVVVQAYGPRAAHVIDWLHALAERLDRRIMVRLVKGAYWDTEIKRAQVLGLAGFPVFTRKAHTDVSYIACARKLLDLTDRIYPQFATHNAHSVAAILIMARESKTPTSAFEFQRLHGMGEALHDVVMARAETRCRIYAPVGAHRDLLAYLVRRLLENGANSSFVNQIVDLEISADQIAADPFQDISGPSSIPTGATLFPDRRNARGWDLTDPLELAGLDKARAPFARGHQWTFSTDSGARVVTNPANPSDVVGQIADTPVAEAGHAVTRSLAAQADWAARTDRANILERAADLYEAHAGELMALAAREAGKTLPDAVGELREAVDFLRYYAIQARSPRPDLRPRGVFVCISPWNFPLAIFTGQISAALVTGNAVIAKPAEQTPLIATRAIQLLHQAGVPSDVLQCLPGDGAAIGAALTADPRIGGVAFTGSTEVAKLIDRQLAATAPSARLIAETGGLNAMIVDSTALPEQAVRDILASAFQSAGQRCSSLRMLYVQRDIEARFLEMLTGAMDAQRLGDPWDLSTDVGPVIDAEAHATIQAHCRKMEAEGRLIHALDTPADGHFIGPRLYRMRGIDRLEREVFGPVLHVARFDADRLDQVIDDINARGYGLTFGLHTRIDARVQEMVDRIHVGNAYVNRNQIGAIVGSQPFGGHGLSGTGPKAGGPLYLSAFQTGARSTNVSSAEGPQVTAVDAGAALAKLDATSWARRDDRGTRLQTLLKGQAAQTMAAAAAVDQGPIDLPGPTGESNRYRLEPRGTVLCLGPAATLLDQVVTALAMGNAVLAICPGAGDGLAVLTDGDLPLSVLDGRLPVSVTADIDIDLVVFGGVADQLRLALAGRSGPILPLVTGPARPEDFVLERAICIDTTAAGGNTALLASTE
ncbi:MAG: bifunctional proline dehydrogenase/L-glutamate gamma-semialdehyde dehydrogenase PutA [Pseudomonadota bacterium]